MTFIRAKEIPLGSGNWYDYEVETIHKGKKVIQKHIRYIGKSSRTSMPTGNRIAIADTRSSVAVADSPKTKKQFEPKVACKVCH